MELERNNKFKIEIHQTDKKVVLAAAAYARIGMYAYSRAAIGVDTKNIEETMYFEPAIANLSLSCEIYMKSYLAPELRKKIGHFLDDLFEAIPLDVQKIIVAKLVDEKIVTSTEEFKQKLKDMRKVYVDWRYYYELLGSHKSLSLDFLVALTKAFSSLEGLLENERKC